MTPASALGRVVLLCIPEGRGGAGCRRMSDCLLSFTSEKQGDLATGGQASNGCGFFFPVNTARSFAEVL